MVHMQMSRFPSKKKKKSYAVGDIGDVAVGWKLLYA
jgi:hypothetical protein